MGILLLHLRRSMAPRMVWLSPNVLWSIRHIMEFFGSFWPTCDCVRLMSLSIVWSCKALWSDKRIPI